MLIVISPAKTLDYETPPVTSEWTKPDLLEYSDRLIQILRTYSALDLAELMKLSIKLAELNQGRYHNFHAPFTPADAKQAVLAMKGDVYMGLDAESFDAQDFAFAQRHLRILSGLYGVLRPLDLMQPYRLEMGTRLRNEAGDTLYDFWGGIITAKLNEALIAQGEAVLINLASGEYFRSVRGRELVGEIITPQFKERKGNGYKVIGVHAKRARGLMSRYIIRNRLQETEQIKGFDVAGYRYDEGLSTAAEWVFIRG